MLRINRILFIINGICYSFWGIRFLYYYILGKIKGQRSHILHRFSISIEEIVIGVAFFFLGIFFKSIFKSSTDFLQPYLIFINIIFLGVTGLRILRYFLNDDPINDSTSILIKLQEKK